MSSVTYKEALSDPTKLVGFANSKKYMDEKVQLGDMLFNEKKNEIIIVSAYTSTGYYLINITTHKFQATTGVFDRTRSWVMTALKNYLQDFVYVPVNQIESLNLDIQMK